LLIEERRRGECEAVPCETASGFILQSTIFNQQSTIINLQFPFPRRLYPIVPSFLLVKASAASDVIFSCLTAQLVYGFFVQQDVDLE